MTLLTQTRYFTKGIFLSAIFSATLIEPLDLRVKPKVQRRFSIVVSG